MKSNIKNKEDFMEYNTYNVRLVLCTMFNLKQLDLLVMDSRAGNKCIARRFYIYYLWRFKNVKHYHMKRFIFGIHHASCIHHCKVMENDLYLSNLNISKYKTIRKQFITFLYYADRSEWEKLKIDQAFSIEELEDVYIDKKYVDCQLNLIIN